jgi:hypothetical protein
MEGFEQFQGIYAMTPLSPVKGKVSRDKKIGSIIVEAY